ncbi:MAG TPA: hypothetical protein VFV87_18825 [Pirellulaceae bacterium]|nr:hypothetical protein [Pirellulaceae bacterium]
MSEPIPACISIGGKLPRHLVPQLCESIQADGLSLEWGDAHFRPKTAEDLLDACRDERGVSILWLCDDQADWGRLPNLEDFLTKVGKLPFDLRSEGKMSFDPDLVRHRPGKRPVQITTNAQGDPVVIAQLLAPVVKTLAKAADAKSRQDCQADVQRALRRLRSVLPPKIAPLPPFEIG